VAIPKPKGSRPPANADDKEQSELFIKKARKIGADEEHSASDELIGQLAKKPPDPRTTQRKASREK
jgi:hypothetical protein